MDMKDDSIVLFTNDKEGNDKRPDFTGTALWKGQEISISLWDNVSKKGNRYLSGKLQEPYNNGNGTSKPAVEGTDIPF